MWKGKYWSTDNTINRKRKGKHQKYEISCWKSCTNTETIYFGDHRCLSWLGGSKCMYTQGNDGTMWEFLKSTTRGSRDRKGERMEGKLKGNYLRFNSCYPLVALFKNSHMAQSLQHVYIHLISSDIERHLWSPKYIKFLCACVCMWLSSRDLFIFW